MRFAQKDILDYIKDDNYKTHEWPQDYWPRNNIIDSSEEWKSLKSRFFEDQKELIDYIQDPKNDFLNPVNIQTKNTLLREILLVIEHNAYHTG